MRAKEVSYRKVFALGNFETETYSVTVELEHEDESIQLAIETARKHIEIAHAKVIEGRAKPERMEKLQDTSYNDGKVHLTDRNCGTILKAIKSGKASREYVYNNFTFDAYAKNEVEKLFKQLNK